jgi:signal transduction histidine kinase
MYKKTQNEYQENDKSFDLLMQVWIRFIIAFSSLLAYFVDPVDSGYPSEITHILLISYCLYSACFVFLYDMDTFLELASKRAIHWFDVLFFSGLIALTGGADSLFYLFLFFPIIVASFSMGFKEGQRVSLAAVILFSLVGAIFIPPGKSYELAEAIVRPICLIVFGYMIAYWGEGRIVLKRRLGLLQEIGTNWNPRFGVNHAMKMSLMRLVEFFRGNRCFVVIERTDHLPRYVMYTSDRRKSRDSEEPKEIADTTARELLVFPRTLALSYENSSSGFRNFNRHIAYDIETSESTSRFIRECETLSNLFDDESFITVPYRQQGIASGRLFLGATNKEFTRSDIAFVQQVADVISSVIENMQLIENLVEEAEGQERHRISLDVHDTTIQPYIGLTLALDALSREFSSDQLLASRINEIIHMANLTIHDLRSYKDTLREKSLMRGEFLISAVKNQAERLLQFYGIRVEVSGAVEPNLSGQIAEACFQIVKEGLSNILRHTNSKEGFVVFDSTERQLSLKIGNRTDEADGIREPFKPKSICERATSLNGKTEVAMDIEGCTVISVTMPLVKDQI